MDYEKVSVIMPVLNEKFYIKNCLESLLTQDYPKEYLEIILVDGNSTDGTTEILNEYAEKYDFIKVIENPKKTVQFALNLGIKNSTGTYIVRMDAHADYEKDYISKCVEYLIKTGADNVGGPTVAKGKFETQKIIAAAYKSPFALGGSKHYDENFEGYADTVAWGAFKKQTLVDIGMYDERLPRSEDEDLNLRIVKNGGKIYITPEIKSVYYPKNSFEDLFKQYYNYGLWKVAVMKKHKRPTRLAHLAPMLFVAFLALLFILPMISFSPLKIIFSFIPLKLLKLSRAILFLYIILDIYFSFSSNLSTASQKLGLMLAHFIIHVSYGIGFWHGIFKFRNFNWDKQEEF